MCRFIPDTFWSVSIVNPARANPNGKRKAFVAWKEELAFDSWQKGYQKSCDVIICTKDEGGPLIMGMQEIITNQRMLLA